MMGVEIEKKYRLTHAQEARLRERLRDVGAAESGEKFEENTLYGGHGLDPSSRVLRLRRVGGRAVLTYKERYASESAVKRQREDETRVEDADALAAILDALGYRPVIVYEKRRATWHHTAGVEIVIDELPFGRFVEIEGEEDSIIEVERLLDLTDARAEHASYPELVLQNGTLNNGVTEARFAQ